MDATVDGAGGQASGGLSQEEKAALKQRTAELRKEARRGRGNKAAADELDVMTKIAEMPTADRAVAERIHTIVTTAGPELSPKLWYGQPAYARKGKVLCFFRSGQADQERYSTFGFTPEADLDDAEGLWATSFAVTELSDKAERTISALVHQAVGRA